jgi:hypothetical protein
LGEKGLGIFSIYNIWKYWKQICRQKMPIFIAKSVTLLAARKVIGKLILTPKNTLIV